MNAHTIAHYSRQVLHRASLIDIRSALRTARRWNDTATVAALNNEIARRLGA